jgi:hypothetical protein
MSTNLLSQFLKARELIDTDAKNVITAPAKGKKPVANVMEKPRMDESDSVRSIIEAKPSKKVVMEFLKRKVAQYTDMSSDDDL